jgi:hypothetical protein
VKRYARMRALTVATATLVTIVTMAPAAAHAKEKTATPPKEPVSSSCADMLGKGHALASAGATKVACLVQDSTGNRMTTADGPRTMGAPCTPGADKLWTVNSRFVACREVGYTIQIFRNFVLVGEINLLEVQNITTSNNDATWAHEYRLMWRSAWGDIAGAMIDNGQFGCGGQCRVISSEFPAMRLDRPTNLTAVGRMAGDPGPGGVTFGTSTVGWTFSAPRTIGFSANRGTGVPQVRCDGFFGVFGCVFRGVKPVLVIDGFDPRITQYARHVKQAQASTGHGTPFSQPLTKTTDPRITSANGRIACPPRRITPPGKTCDEYPFASTLEGASALPNNGRTFPGCLFDARLPIGVQGPGWSACMIDERHNRNGGTDLLIFYRTQRVIDGDQFFVVVINI